MNTTIANVQWISKKTGAVERTQQFFSEDEALAYIEHMEDSHGHKYRFVFISEDDLNARLMGNG